MCSYVGDSLTICRRQQCDDLLLLKVKRLPPRRACRGRSRLTANLSFGGRDFAEEAVVVMRGCRRMVCFVGSSDCRYVIRGTLQLIDVPVEAVTQTRRGDPTRDDVQITDTSYT